MVDKDPESDFPSSNYTPVPDGHVCLQERRLRDIEREARETRSRLGQGDVCLATLRSSVDSLKASVDRLDASVNELSKPSAVMQKIIDAAIQWAVPAGIVIIVWALVKSGAVTIQPDTHQPKSERSSP
jgi:hypothetical protein